MRKYFVTVALCLVILEVVFMTWALSLPKITEQRPAVVMEVLDPSLRLYAPAWQREIGRRFPNAVGVLCHGGDHLNGVWDCTATNCMRYLTVQQVVKYEQKRYPDKVIVLLCCNGGHQRLGISGVYYAPDLVWLVPDHEYLPDSLDGKITLATTQPALKLTPLILYFPVPKTRWEENPTVVGNIFEFISE